MKKLTWLLLSLMLFLGMGTAFAQDEAETPATLPALTFTPASGSTVAPGDDITFDIPTEYQNYMIYLFYTTDATAFAEATTYEGKMALVGEVTETDDEGDPTYTGPIMTAGYMGGNWMMPCMIPSDVEQGALTLQAFWVMQETMQVSDIMTITYTVKGEAEVIPAPTLNPNGGEVAAGTSVEVKTGFEDTDNSDDYWLYYVIDNPDFDFSEYETDDDLPTSVKEIYGNIKINAAMTITVATAKVKQTMAGNMLTWSEPVTATYTIKEVEPEPANDVPMPVFSPNGGTVVSGTKIVLTNGTENDDTPKPIYYNFKAAGNETAFTSLKTKSALDAEVKKSPASLRKVNTYPEGGIELTAAKPISAATADIDEDGNITWSTIVTKSFTIGSAGDVLEAPTFNPDGGEIGMDEGIEISTTTAGARVYYDVTSSTFAKLKTEEELDAEESSMLSRFSQYSSSMKPSLEELGGTTPGAKVSLSAAAVLIAADGSLTWSEVTTREFTVKAEEGPVEEVAIPVITPGNDQPAHMGDKVTITCATAGAEIYYTTNGSAPFNMDKDGYPVSVKEGDTVFKYTEPFELTEDMLIKQNAVWAIKIRAVAVKGTAISSNGGSAGYNVYPNNPTFSVEAGEVEKGTKVEITCIPSQAVIYYTVDGTTPTMESGLLYAEAIELTEDVTVKAIAVLGQYQSSVVTAAYTVTEPVVEPVEAPVFNPAAGEVEKGTKVSIVCATEGAVIYYTVDGTEPTAESTEYKDEIAINEDMTIKAIAVKGEAKSEVAEAAYTIFTANEDLELAGVTVYPNPSNGLFNIDLPVAATIEVFASNGVLTQRVNAAAGVFTLTLDRSGIYFLRIAGEGRATVKRVVVR